MIEGLKPYSAYTETGLPWLGQIPATWKLRRAKYLFREVDERSRTGSEELLSVSHKTGVTPRSQKNVTMFMAESNVGHKICRPDDLVINTLWAWMAALGVSRHHGMVSPAYGVYRPIDPSGFRPSFADQLLRTPFYAAEYQRCSTGVNSSRLRLYPEAFFRIPIMLPPKEEQEAIVRFLAHANQKIDGFIRAKRKLIGLLNEQKQAIIHQAVTRGLDPSVPLKPSGIPWLGDIPKHWELKRFKFVATINSGQVDPTMQSFRQMVLIAPNHIQSGTGRIVGLETASSQGADSGKYLVSKGQVIYSKIRPNLKKAVIAPCDCLCSADMYPITPRSEILPEFLLTLLLSQPFTNFATDASMRVAMPKVNREALANCHMWYPSHDEQLALLAAVEKESEPYNRAITRTEREIALMQEYRTRLTADLVTGRLDVREAASKLPEVDNYSLPQTADDADETEEAMEEEEA